MGTVFFMVIGLTLYLFDIVPKGFIPEADTDQINIAMHSGTGNFVL